MDDKLYFIRLLVSSAAELRKLVRRAYVVVDSEQRTKGHFLQMCIGGKERQPTC